MSAEPRFSGDLDKYEIFWRDHAAWLKDHGYQLQLCYQLEWKPSWSANNTRDRYKYEDAQEAKGIQFLHSRHITHNDIKHNNLMVDSTPLFKHLMHPRSLPFQTKDMTGTVPLHPNHSPDTLSNTTLSTLTYLNTTILKLDQHSKLLVMEATDLSLNSKHIQTNLAIRSRSIFTVSVI
ncbi:hypothetical protein VKT23_013705 [Stygiomarasmius scandens]|uniref:Protein kinase domain-containing protein n=1 Tax=Marasmiellus scandens TaxID=2682957 RepID=A0ABR1J3J4_9AGAR